MDDILDPYGYNPDQVSWLGVGLMVAGIISAALMGAYVEKTLKYRRMFWLCSILGILTTIGFPLFLKFISNEFWVCLILVVMQGTVFIPLQPLSIDYGCDTLFPMGEAQISGFLITGGQILGIAFVLISQSIFGLGEGTVE